MRITLLHKYLDIQVITHRFLFLGDYFHVVFLYLYLFVEVMLV